MTDLIVVISRDDTFMHIGPADQVAEHLFGASGDVALPGADGPGAGDAVEHLQTGVALGFGDLDTFDEAGGPLEWAVDRNLRPRHVHPVPDAAPDPAALLDRIRSVVAHLNAAIAARPDLTEFRDGFYAQRLVSPPDLATAVNTFADLGRPGQPTDPPHPTHGSHDHGPGSSASRTSRRGAAVGSGRAHPRPGHELTPGDLTTGVDPLDPPTGQGGAGGLGTIPHAGSWFHNLMHRITGT
jgi:hypothetical protein